MFLNKKVSKIFLLVVVSTLFVLPTKNTVNALVVSAPGVTSAVVANTSADATASGITQGLLVDIETTQLIRSTLEVAESTQATLHRNSICLKEVGPGCIPAPGLTLDSIVQFATKTLASQIVQTTTNWVRTGFEGRPAFVQDIKQFYENEAYKVVDVYLQKFANVDMCNFFPDMNITLALSGPRAGVEEARCTIDDIRQDAREFEKDFKSGEWLTFKTSLEKNNNPFGLYLFTQAELQNSQAKNKEDQKSKLGWAKGFMSFEEKDDKGKSTGKVLTPGAMIEATFSTANGSGLRSLEIADELDELAGALLQYGIGYALDQGGFFD